MSAPSLDGRWFHSLGPTMPADSDAADGPAQPGEGVDTAAGTTPVGARPSEVGPGTVFRYSEQDGEVWGVYTGGQVRRGYLVGTRDGDHVELRYVHLNDAGETATGRSVSTLRVLDDGRLAMDEVWQWESHPGGGTSVVEELPGEPPSADPDLPPVG